MPPLYLLHPAVVHFPLALLIAGAGAAAVGEWRGRPKLTEAATWLLWLGAASLWAALGLGLLAEKTAPHVPSAWEVLEAHETAAFWTAGLFTAAALWRSWGRYRRAQVVFWLLALLPLIRTAQLGGELVFTHGFGVTADK